MGGGRGGLEEGGGDALFKIQKRMMVVGTLWVNKGIFSVCH